MPEGPEVKRNTDFLDKMLGGKLIEEISILSGRYEKHGPFKGYEDMIAYPRIVTEVCCKGKFIYFKFQDGTSLWSTLGMSASWQKQKTTHSRVQIKTNYGNTVFFNDIRNFGTLKFVDTTKALKDKLNTLGPDVLGSYVDTELFKSRLDRKPKWTIAKALMNQSVVSGIGNYLKAEILYASKISPHRLCKDLTQEEIAEIAQNSFNITKASYQSGGATISTYRDENNKKGLYSRRFMVYNHKVDPKGNKVIKETTTDKRSTYWVPEIQK
jgi:DNA-formamidopyrimidine glycosylase